MTRTEIQEKINAIKQDPAFDGSSFFIINEMNGWLSSQGVTEEEKNKIIDDLESYAY